LPVLHNREKAEIVLNYCRELKSRLEATFFQGEPLRVLLDERDLRGGEKKWNWVKKGIPIRLEVGPRDIEQNTLMVSRRNKQNHKEKQSEEQFLTTIGDELMKMQSEMFENAKQFRDQNVVFIEDKDAFYSFFSSNSEQGF